MYKKILQKTDEHPIISMIGLILFIVVFYLPTFSNTFTNWDDPANIIYNPYITAFSIKNIKAWYTVPLLGMYSPLVYFSYAIDYSAGYLNPFSYHLSNLVLHLINVFLIQLLLFQLIYKRSVAIILALFFAVHPLIISGVTPLSIRSNLLYTLFLLLALRSYFNYILKGQNVASLYLTLFFFLLSVLSKSAAVVFPLIMLAADYFFRRRFSLKLIIEKLPFFTVSLLTGLLSIYYRTDAGVSLGYYNLTDKVFLAFYSLSYYSFKWFLPIHFSPLYDYPVKLNEFLPLIYYLSIFWIILSGGLIWLFRKNRLFIFGILFYLINLLLVIKVIPVGMEYVSDRYGYVSSIGLLIALLGIINQFKSYLSIIATDILLAVYFLFLLWFVFLGQHRQTEWKDAKSLWLSVTKKQSKMALAYINMGVLYAAENKSEEAIAYYNKAIQVKANYPEAFFNRANAYRRLNNNKKALEDYNRCIEFDPYYYKAILNRGTLYKDSGLYQYAIQDINKAISLKPNSAEVYYNRGVIRFELNDLNGSLIDFSKSIQLDPENYQAYANRGSLYFLMNSYQKALEDMNKAIKINPEFALAYENRAKIELNLNLKDQACSDLKMVVGLGLKPEPDLIKKCCD